MRTGDRVSCSLAVNPYQLHKPPIALTPHGLGVQVEPRMCRSPVEDEDPQEVISPRSLPHDCGRAQTTESVGDQPKI